MYLRKLKETPEEPPFNLLCHYKFLLPLYWNNAALSTWEYLVPTQYGDGKRSGMCLWETTDLDNWAMRWRWERKGKGWWVSLFWYPLYMMSKRYWEQSCTLTYHRFYHIDLSCHSGSESANSVILHWCKNMSINWGKQRFQRRRTWVQTLGG